MKNLFIYSFLQKQLEQLFDFLNKKDKKINE